MGLTNVRMTVRPLEKSFLEEDLDFLVDSGALYTVLPHTTWKRLGIEPRQRLPFSLADGTVIEREVGYASLTYAGTEGPCKVILGEPNDEPLLGATSLETLGYVLDPLRRRIIRARMRM